MHPAARGLPRAPGQQPGARWHSAAAAVARALSSPVFGLALIACIVVYLALASAAPGLLATAMRTEPSGLYRHWLLVSAGLLLCLGVLASLVRTPLSPASAGAWCGHLGVLVLACGAGWYALAAVSGDCVALRTAAGWSTIAYFQESGAYAAYVSEGRQPAPRQTRLSPRQLAALVARPVRLDCDVVGMEARAVDFRQAAALRPSADAGIVDSGEENAPALCVELAVGDWSARAWVPFAGWQDLAPQHRVDLPGGGAAYLSFARPEVTLPEPVTVLTAEYLRHPGSAIPWDYRCRVSVGGRQTEIRLNKPLALGPYQLSQGAWLPSPDDVDYIVFLVSSRPGLLLVWLGCLMIAAGLPYAFYVRPLILRRRKGGGK